MRRVALAERPLALAVFIAFALWVLLRLVEQVMWALVVFLLAIILAAALMPIVRLLRRPSFPPGGWRLPKAIAAVVVYVIAGLVLLAVAFLLGRSLAGDVASFTQNLPATAARLTEQAREVAGQLGAPQLVPSPAEAASQAQVLSGQALNALRLAETVAGSSASLLFRFFLVLTLAVFLVAQSQEILSFWVSLFPPGQRDKVRAITAQSGEKVGHWALGQLAVATIVGILAGLVVFLLGLPYPVAVGVLTAVLDLAPVLGPGLMAIPVALLGLVEAPWKAVVAGLAFYALSQVDANVLSPLITGRAVSLSPVLIVMAITLGLALYGAVGALVAIPVAAALQLVAEQAVLPWLHARYQAEDDFSSTGNQEDEAA
jgi:predicted PurR-regulated permease PerM